MGIRSEFFIKNLDTNLKHHPVFNLLSIYCRGKGCFVGIRSEKFVFLLLPGKPLLPEVSVGADLVVVHIQQMKAVYDPSRC